MEGVELDLHKREYGLMNQMEQMGITFTDEAAVKLKELLESDMVAELDEPVVAMRVFVKGGGCNGFEYGFAFESKIDDDDVVSEKNGVKFIMDPLSLQYFPGATIDYKKSLWGEQFTIDNPNQTSQCGCGNSVGF